MINAITLNHSLPYIETSRAYIEPICPLTSRAYIEKLPLLSGISYNSEKVKKSKNNSNFKKILRNYFTHSIITTHLVEKAEIAQKYYGTRVNATNRKALQDRNASPVMQVPRKNF